MKRSRGPKTKAKASKPRAAAAAPGASAPAAPPARGRGRPAVEEARPEVWKQFFDAVKAGASFRSAAYYAGVAFETAKGRIRRARAGNDPEFLAQLHRALGDGEVELLERIRSAALDPAQWRAAAFLLSCRNPRRYTPAGRLEAEAEAGKDGVVKVRLRIPRPGVHEAPGEADV